MSKIFLEINLSNFKGAYNKLGLFPGKSRKFSLSKPHHPTKKQTKNIKHKKKIKSRTISWLRFIRTIMYSMCSGVWIHVWASYPRLTTLCIAIILLKTESQRQNKNQLIIHHSNPHTRANPSTYINEITTHTHIHHQSIKTHNYVYVYNNWNTKETKP